MFFILSKTVSFLFMPGTLIGITWALFFILRKWKYRKYLSFLGFSLFLIFTNDFFANFLLDRYQTPVTVLDKEQHFTYGVLLTGMTNTLKLPEDRVYFHQNGDRMLQTLKLFYEGRIDTLIIAGGGATALRKDLHEATVLNGYLKSIKLPQSKIKLESQSRNTYETAIFLKDILTTQELLLISSASHLPRATRVFEKQGFNVTAYGTTYLTNDKIVSPAMFIPSADAFFKWHILFKEWMGFVAYKVAGFI